MRRLLADRRAAVRVEDLERAVERLRKFERDDDDLAFWLPDFKGYDRVRLADILWISAERDYVRIHVADRSYLVRGRIGDVAVRLAGCGLLRVHRSALVRTGAVVRIERRGDRNYRLCFGNGAFVSASRRLAAIVRESLEREAG